MQTSAPELIARHRARGAWTDRRIHDLFDEAVAAVPGRLALVDPPNREALTGEPPQRLTFAELATRAAGYARALTAAGLGRDDVLITQLPNIADYVAVYLAAFRLGVIVSPVPMQFRAYELGEIARLTGARAGLTVARFKGARTALAEFAAAGTAPGLRGLVMGDAADLPEGCGGFAPLPPAADGVTPPAGHPDAAQKAPHGADDVATICWTSGTEGSPKGVPRTHNHWMAIAPAHFDGVGLRDGDVMLNPFPLVNMAAIGGCFLSWLLARGTLVLHHPLDLPVYLQQIARERPQYAIAPPAVLNMLLKDERLLASLDLSSLRCIGSGSAPLDPAMIRGYADRFGIEIVNIFGSNEGMSLFSGAKEAPDPERRARFFPRFGRAELDWPQRSASMIETRIVDPGTHLEVGDVGVPGEMQIRGPTVFDGYFAAPERTREAFTPDGWFRTGDLFEIAADERGPRYYRYVGRLKQLIIRGGVKISPEELDEVLSRHPAVLEGAVAPYGDAIMGERIAAIVVPRPGMTVTLESLQQHFEQAGLASFKRPERLRIAGQLPRNPLGKLLRAELSRVAEEDAPS
jgi:acyl-CoA synthetase (AMP-forming)/AMP-acid ligase II